MKKKKREPKVHEVFHSWRHFPSVREATVRAHTGHYSSSGSCIVPLENKVWWICA